jgi:molybdopterin-guanine dinucleotide biosynthesis protein A
VEPERSQVAALVLAGGAASRFGADKTRAELEGRPVLAHVLDAVDLVASRVVVVGPWAPAGREHHDEPGPRRGPAAAIAFGMGLVDADAVLVVGGDHPLLRPALLSSLVARLLAGRSGAVVPVRDGRDEPLVACYRREVGAVAAGLVAAGERHMRAVLDAVVVERVAPGDWRPLDPDGRSFLDVDTPEDLVRVRQQLRSTAPPA